MGIIEENEIVAWKLACYEILHQCEELIIKSDAIVQLQNANFTAKKKSI